MRNTLNAAGQIGGPCKLRRPRGGRSTQSRLAVLYQALGAREAFDLAVMRAGKCSDMYTFRELVAGGLISYGTSLIENYRQVGTGFPRSIPDAKPSLPVG
jgi:hypothetical protein